MRRLAVVTTSRADFGIYRPLLRAIADYPDLDLQLIVAGMHLSPLYGLTVREIEAEGWPIAARVNCLEEADSPLAVARAMGRAVIGLAEALAELEPDIEVVLGDRFEMHAAALAALPLNLPVAHLHGGELTLGAFDDALRHSMTKLSHLHFAATEDYARRIIQLGEEEWRVTVSGAPSLDNLAALDVVGPGELAEFIGLELDPAPLLVTYHPVSLEQAGTEDQLLELLAALDKTDRPVVFTLPNADPGNSVIRRLIADWTAARERAAQVEHLGTRRYFGLMKLAAAMVGNSSSGIIEAASFELPVVNIGSRQAGRTRASNVIDCGYGREEILAAIERATGEEFRALLKGLVNPYGDGRAAGRIVAKLAEVELGQRLLVKQFNDRGGEA